MRTFRYIGRTKFSGACADCEFHGVLRTYETASGWLYLCPDCGHVMEQEYASEIAHTQKEKVKRV